MEGIEAKVKKLLSLADLSRGATEAEAANAAEKAALLARKFGIDMASINLEEDESSPIDVEDNFLALGAGNWRRSLANSLAKNFGAMTVRIPGQGHKCSLHIFAPEGTLSSYIETYRTLEAWIENEADIATAMRVDTYVHGRTYKTSWIEGCVSRITQRLKDKRLHEEAESQTQTYSQALVKVDGDVEASRAKVYPNLVTVSRTRRVGDYGAYQSGKAAGSSADLGGKKLHS